MAVATHEVTQLLRAWNAGDEAAFGELVPLVYEELHRMAGQYLRKERNGCGLQTTALVNEAYLRLIDARQVEWQNRTHFFAIAARLMRRILVDFARERNYQKRGGGAIQVSLDEAAAVTEARAAELLAVDEALEKLTAMDARKGRIVELRFYGGLTEEEIAETLKVSPETVRREWRAAKAWLHRMLTEGASNDS